MTQTHLLGRLSRLITRARRVARERAEFARLRDRDLHDFGASRADIAWALNKPFWRD